MRRLRVSIPAERDLNLILAASEERFGEAAAIRYRRLVSAALRDLRLDATRAGVRAFGDSDVKLYHLRHSRSQVPGGRRIGRPRHLLAFRQFDDDTIILRVLHDAMDLPRHLQDV